MEPMFTCPLDGCGKSYPEEWKHVLHCQTHERSPWLPVQYVPGVDGSVIPPFKERNRV